MQELMQKAEHLTFEATEVLRLIKGKIPHMSLTDYGNPFRHMWKLDDLSVITCVDISEFLLSNAYEDTPEIINLRKASLKESEEVKKEYRRLKAEVGTMRSIPKMVKYLKNLGFDVTWLEEQLKIEEPVEKLDTSKLFVCGENK
jgi:hypothetical protein